MKKKSTYFKINYIWMFISGNNKNSIWVMLSAVTLKFRLHLLACAICRRRQSAAYAITELQPLRDQGWRSCGSACFPPMWPGSISGLGVICGLNLLIFYPALTGFLLGPPAFPSPQKPTFDLIWFNLYISGRRATPWRQLIKPSRLIYFIRAWMW